MALALSALSLFPISVMAASGLPPTITMTPQAAGPGSQVEVVGLDFPPGGQVDLLLTTTAGPVPLGSTVVEEAGYFRQSVVFPAELAPGFWELRATGPQAAVAVLIFEALDPSVLASGAIRADASASSDTLVRPTTPSSLIDPNLVVMAVLVLFAVGMASAGAFIWYQTHRKEGEPGMGAGDDPIWSGARARGNPR